MNEEQKCLLINAMVEFCARCFEGKASKEEMSYLPSTLQTLVLIERDSNKSS